MTKVKGLRWLIISLIGLVTVINYIDRNALAVMWPAVSKDIGADKADYALLVTVFMVAYAAGQSLFGKLLDRIGTRMGFVIAIAVWSVSIGAHALVRSLGALLFFRGTLGQRSGQLAGRGQGQCAVVPAAGARLCAGYLQRRCRDRRDHRRACRAALYGSFGWRATFVLVGVLGLVWLIPWFFIYRADPDRHPWLSDEERAHIAARPATADAPESEAPAPGMLELLRYRQSWAILIARFFLDPVWWLFVSWLPIYLAETFGFDVKQIGMFGWVPFVGAMLGSLGGGWFSGAAHPAGWTAAGGAQARHRHRLRDHAAGAAAHCPGHPIR
jgi:ACS family hexuronate transporter-like MFS transporter